MIIIMNVVRTTIELSNKNNNKVLCGFSKC